MTTTDTPPADDDAQTLVLDDLKLIAERADQPYTEQNRSHLRYIAALITRSRKPAWTKVQKVRGMARIMDLHEMCYGGKHNPEAYESALDSVLTWINSL